MVPEAESEMNMSDTSESLPFGVSRLHQSFAGSLERVP